MEHDLASVVPAGELGNNQIYSDRHIPVEVRDHMNIADLELILGRVKGHDERSHHGLKLALTDSSVRTCYPQPDSAVHSLCSQLVELSSMERSTLVETLLIPLSDEGDPTA